jgi:AbrB family looped-hinge helix DNA binding protein
MNTTVTIDKAGRLVLPKPIRDALHLKPGSSLEVEQREDEVVLRPPQPEAQLVKKMGMWVLRTPGVVITPEMVEDTLREVREEREYSADGESLLRYVSVCCSIPGISHSPSAEYSSGG